MYTINTLYSMLDLFDYPVPLISSTLDHFGFRKKFSESKFWMDLTVQLIWAKFCQCFGVINHRDYKLRNWDQKRTRFCTLTRPITVGADTQQWTMTVHFCEHARHTTRLRYWNLHTAS